MTENKHELTIYQTEDGRSRVQLRLEDSNAWLTQQQIAELFETTKQNVSLHIQNIYEDGELSKEATVKYYLTVRQEGNREVHRELEYYNLDIILAVGYRVRSPRGVQFRRWASEKLKVLTEFHPERVHREMVSNKIKTFPLPQHPIPRKIVKSGKSNS